METANALNASVFLSTLFSLAHNYLQYYKHSTNRLFFTTRVVNTEQDLMVNKFKDRYVWCFFVCTEENKNSLPSPLHSPGNRYKQHDSALRKIFSFPLSLKRYVRLTKELEKTFWQKCTFLLGEKYYIYYKI